MKRKTLFLISDSHGNHLQQHFEKFLPSWEVKVSYYPGATSQDIHLELKKLSREFCIDQGVVIIHVGTNNFYLRTPAFIIRQHNDDIISSLVETVKYASEIFPTAEIIYSANLPRLGVPGHEKRKDEVNESVRQQIADTDRVHFLSHEAQFKKGGVPNQELLVSDGLHMNPKGQITLVKNILEKTVNVLEKEQ